MINDDYIINLFFKNDKIQANYLRDSWLVNNNEIHNYLLNRYNDSLSLSETCYRILYNIDERPVCKICGNPVKYICKGKYKNVCSISCATKLSYLQKSDEQKQIELNARLNAFKLNCSDIQCKRIATLTSKSEEEKERIKIKKQNTWKSHSEDEKNKIIKKTQKTCLVKYGVTNKTKLPDIKEKIQQTCFKKYGVKSYLEISYIKSKDGMLKKYGVDNAAKLPTNIFKTNNPSYNELSIEKRKQTCLIKYGVDNYWKSDIHILKTHTPEVNNKRVITKRNNGTFNTSIDENLSYNLLKDVFPNVITQYKDKIRYPFVCDFYIPDLDIFIECNYHWTHGGHPYNENNIDDIDKANKWKEKNTKYYDNAINTWTIRDVNKRNIAKDNSLNYFEFWNIDELKKWLQVYAKI